MAAVSIVLTACAPVRVAPSDDFLREVFETSGTEPAVDARAGFRRVFCEVLAADRMQADARPSCDALLRSFPPERDHVPAVPAPGDATESFAILVVPGLGYSCLQQLVGGDPELVRYLESRGHLVRVAAIDGLSGSRQNSMKLYEQILRLDEASGDRRIVALSYSKGTNDLLEAIARYPDLANRLTAVAGVASAVGGSPLARKAPLWAINLFAGVPGVDCGEAPSSALRSLYPQVRRRWLEQHTLPPAIEFFSVVALPEADNVAPLLRVSYRALADFDPQNDGQVIARDQVIPGSRLLAFVNADHWLIALPASRVASVTGLTGFGRSEFPRYALIEAILRYLGAAVPGERQASE